MLTTVRNYKGSFPPSFASVVQTVNSKEVKIFFFIKHVFSCNSSLKYCLRIIPLLHTKVLSLIWKNTFFLEIRPFVRKKSNYCIFQNSNITGMTMLKHILKKVHNCEDHVASLDFISAAHILIHFTFHPFHRWQIIKLFLLD